MLMLTIIRHLNRIKRQRAVCTASVQVERKDNGVRGDSAVISPMHELQPNLPLQNMCDSCV